MKKGLGTGGLILAVLASVFELRAEDVEWQPVSEDARAETPAVVFEKPVALKPPVLKKVTARDPIEAVPGELLPVSFETSTPVVPAVEPPPLRRLAPPAPAQIIATSAPVAVLPPPPAEEEDEPSETPFAADRPVPLASTAGVGRSGVVRTSASSVAPISPTAADVPMVPGWDAPLDASWGVGLPKMPFPVDPYTAAPPAYNPLRPRVYAAGEYLLWWFQGQTVPVLATTSAPNDFGILGAPTTQVLFGGNQINNGPYSGGRFALGYWLGCDQKTAIEINGLFLGSNGTGFSTNSSMNPVIGRPFQEANNGQESAQLTSLPGVTSGMLTVQAPTFLWGLGGNLRCLLCCGCNYRVTAFAGFSNLNLDESLTITENVQGLPTAPQPFTNQMITVTDRFATQNHFYGGNLGADARWYWKRLSVDVRAQVALGDTVQLLDISGTQHFVPGVATATGLQQNFTGGLLALPSNIGHFSHNAFSVIPQMGFNLGYQILPYLRGFVGYNFLYWSNVIRPGTSIDRVLDVTQIPNFPVSPQPAPVPGSHPAPVFHEVGFWAQGLTFGLEFTY